MICFVGIIHSLDRPKWHAWMWRGEGPVLHKVTLKKIIVLNILKRYSIGIYYVLKSHAEKQCVPAVLHTCMFSLRTRLTDTVKPSVTADIELGGDLCTQLLKQASCWKDWEQRSRPLADCCEGVFHLKKPFYQPQLSCWPSSSLIDVSYLKGTLRLYVLLRNGASGFTNVALYKLQNIPEASNVAFALTWFLKSCAETLPFILSCFIFSTSAVWFLSSILTASYWAFNLLIHSKTYFSIGVTCINQELLYYMTILGAP